MPKRPVRIPARSAVRFAATILVALIVAVASLGSAAMMAPAHDDMVQAEISAELDALGLTQDQLCGRSAAHGGHMQHHCPFCHLIPDLPFVAPEPLCRAFIPTTGWRQYAFLHRKAQARDHSRAPRAPPLTA